MGLEAFSAGDKKLAEKAAERCVEAELTPPEPQPDGPPAEDFSVSAVRALCLVLERSVPASFPEDADQVDLGKIEAAARKGGADKAASNRLKLELKFRALVIQATAAADAKDDLDTALKAAEGGGQNPRLVLRLVEVGARAGMDEARLLGVAGKINSPGQRGAQLAVIREKLGAAPRLSMSRS